MTQDGTIRVKAAKIREAMQRKEISAWQIKKATGQDIRTVHNMLAGKACRECTVIPILELLKLDYYDVVVGSRRFVTSANDSQQVIGRRIHEWEVVEVLSDWQTAANGLQYKVCKMKHLHQDNKLARGKQYDLSIPATKDKDRLRTLLNRHPDVCDKFRGHPHIPVNLKTAPAENEDLWWVIDEWVEGPTLEKAIAEWLEGPTRERASGEGAVKSAHLPQVMREIAMGLEALHGEGITLRELCPTSILLREPTGTVVLTEFELAKLSGGKPTVAKDRWPRNPYRAKEVGAPNIDTTVDLYSWGRILVRAVCGKPLPRRGKEREALAKATLPKQVLEIAVACTNRVCTNRPRGIGEVIEAIRKWR